eukprot:2609589-Pyramimonas_sp.AAC.1
MVDEMNGEESQFASMGEHAGQKHHQLQQSAIMTRPIPHGPTARSTRDAMDESPSTSRMYHLSQPDPNRRGCLGATNPQEPSAFSSYARPLYNQRTLSANDQRGGAGTNWSSPGRDANSVNSCTRLNHNTLTYFVGVCCSRDVHVRLAGQAVLMFSRKELPAACCTHRLCQCECLGFECGLGVTAIRIPSGPRER